jgi:maltose alpha-D-glucosyltransferase/alpha-amylase
MQWTSANNAGFSDAPDGDFYLPIDPVPDRPNVEAQQRAPDSMLNFTRTLLHLRQSVPALSNIGGFRVVYAEPLKAPFVYQRSNGDQHVIVAVNPTAAQCEVSLAETNIVKPLLVQKARWTNGILQMDPMSFGIFLA